MFHILREVGAETKVSLSVTSTLPLKKRKNTYRSSRWVSSPKVLPSFSLRSCNTRHLQLQICYYSLGVCGQGLSTLLHRYGDRMNWRSISCIGSLNRNVVPKLRNLGVRHVSRTNLPGTVDVACANSRHHKRRIRAMLQIITISNGRFRRFLNR